MPQDSNEHRPINATSFEDGANIGLREGGEHLMSMDVVRALRMVQLAYEDGKEKTKEQVLLEYLMVVGPNLQSFRRSEQEQQGGGLAEVVKFQTKQNPEQYTIPSKDTDIQRAA